MNGRIRIEYNCNLVRSELPMATVMIEIVDIRFAAIFVHWLKYNDSCHILSFALVLCLVIE